MADKFKGKWDIRSLSDLKTNSDLDARRKTKTKQRIPYELVRGEKSKTFKKDQVKSDESIIVLDDKFAFVPVNNSNGMKVDVLQELRDKLDGTSIDDKDGLFNQLAPKVEARFAQFPATILVLAEYEAEGTMSGNFVIKSGSVQTYSGIANEHGYLDRTYENSSQFNTGASWSFANSESGVHHDGIHGNELHQFDHTASFQIRTFTSASYTGSYVTIATLNNQTISADKSQVSGTNVDLFTTAPNHAININSGITYTLLEGSALNIDRHDAISNPVLNETTLSRVDSGKFQYYQYKTGSLATSSVGLGISTAGFNSTIVTAKIFGDGDETLFEEAFSQPTASLYAAPRELITFPYDTVVASGSFIFSPSFETLVGVTAPGQAGYSPNHDVTLFWASGSGGLETEFGLSGSISPNQLIPDIDSLPGIQSGSHIFLNKELTAPASGGYYAILSPLFSNVALTSTLSDGNLAGGFEISGTIHVAGDGMRGLTTSGEDYFQNVFVSAHEVTSSVITAAPRWNGISFSRGSSLQTGDINPRDFT